MHYKGMNKRRLLQLTGVAKSTPTPTDQLEVKLGENWRRAGAVISAVRYDSDVIAIQAVLPSDIEATAQLRIKGQDDSKFTPCQKPDETESINE
jgi:folate-binding Fe-S cluster repair protein YgfZ